MNQDKQLSDVLSEFARTMVTDFPIQAILDHLVVRIVDVLPITAAGVTLITPGAQPRYVAASDDSALRFEEFQAELGEGPCVATYDTGEPVAVADLREDDRFPTFAAKAVDAGLVAVFTFPLRQGEECLGALDLYRDTPGLLDDNAMGAANTLADVAASYLTNAQARADLRDSSDRYRQSSLHDSLTGLPNRVLFRQRIDHAILRARRSGKLVALLFADLDRFKQVNDIHGHQKGDALLIAVAERLTGMLRPGDTLARLSGDEFVVLCEDLADTSQVEPLAVRIEAALALPFDLSGQELQVSASVGIAFAGTGEDVPELLLRDADTAMYQAKRRGGGRHQVVDLREQELLEGRANLEQDLRDAAARGGELGLEYQPIVAISDGRVVGVEALLRWAHPTRGWLSPSLIVPLAEQAGVASQIGRWALETACRDRSRWRSLPSSDDATLSVNVSTQQLMSPDFAETVTAVLFGTKTEPRHVTLEFAEGVFIDDPERAHIVLEELKDLGVTLALDDFGSGHMSLGYLQRFPIDVVKIDPRLVAGLANNPASPVIVSAVVGLAGVLGMTVVAKGVETAEQHKALEDLGCSSCQGFYFARPMSAHDMEVLTRDRSEGGGLRLPVRLPAA
ncbi:MAG TPA: EAL domain-containing protein [Acidimicrobiales bacterium]|nr:EAL domain-containing protein [Acidimicrobiales bacterium]